MSQSFNQIISQDYTKNSIFQRLTGSAEISKLEENFRALDQLLPLDALKAHTHVVAPSGFGKTELMRLLFYWMQERYPEFTYILIDPHGSLAKDVKAIRTDRQVIYIDPNYQEGYTAGFNVFEIGENPDNQTLSQTVEQIFAAFEEVIAKESGGKLSELMKNALEKCIYFILQKPNTNIEDLLNLLRGEPDINEEAAEYDNFFGENWQSQNNRTREALYNRFSRFMNNPTLKNMLLSKNSFNLQREMMIGGKTIIYNIADIGEVSQLLLGKLLVATIKSQIRKRQKNTGIPVFLFIDEAHLLMSGSFEYILSQLRGYGLHLVFANQYIGQLSSKNQIAARQNSAIKIIGGYDVAEIQKVLKNYDPEMGIDKYQFLIKVRNEEIIKYPVPDTLLKAKVKYSLTKEMMDGLDNRLLGSYYFRVEG